MIRKKQSRAIFQKSPYGNFKYGKFIPKNKEKYLGNVDEIVFKSSYELVAFEFCDDNDNVIAWLSEEIAIPYAKPTVNGYKKSIYLPDLYLEYYNEDGEIIKEMIEIKPYKQTIPSRARNPKTKQVEDMTYAINMSKWESAKTWCEMRNINFRLLTERDSFLKKS